MEHMSDKMLVKTIRVLGEIGALDLTALTGTPVPGGRSFMVSIQQAFRLPGVDSEPSLGDRPASNPVKDAGMLQEAMDHITRHLQDKATH
jgi:hypothetical protein